MTFSALYLDDETSALKAFRHLADQLPELGVLDCFTNPEDACDALNSRHYDLLFLDITMPKINGLDFLRSLAHPPVTILTTAYSDYALEAYQLGVRDYLLKPISPVRLQQCLIHVKPLLDVGFDAGEQQMAVKVGSGHTFVKPSKISYLEAAGNFTVLHADEVDCFASESLKSLTTRLEPLGFLRVHKSFLINLTFAEGLEKDYIRLKTGTQIPVGRVYKPAVLAQLEQG